jgi:hypothetical protein
LRKKYVNLFFELNFYFIFLKVKGLILMFALGYTIYWAGPVNLPHFLYFVSILLPFSLLYSILLLFPTYYSFIFFFSTQNLSSSPSLIYEKTLNPTHTSAWLWSRNRKLFHHCLLVQLSLSLVIFGIPNNHNQNFIK